MNAQNRPAGPESMNRYGLMDALLNRRSRRFGMGMEIPSGVLKYKSKHQPEPLSELEKNIILAAMAGSTGWNNLIPFNSYYQPHLPNYAGSAGGRIIPSAAGFHTSQLFFTDDTGVYFLDTRDAPALVQPSPQGTINPDAFVEQTRARIHRLQDHRLVIPAEIPYYEGHNTWVANMPGTLLAFPVVDIAQHIILALLYFLQNGTMMYDDIHNRPIPGSEKFAHLTYQDPLPLTFVEQYSMCETMVEIGCGCFAGALALQAMGLGGWMFNGLNPYAVLGVPDDPKCPGLGFAYEHKENWPLPNPAGLKGVFEGFCPPFYTNMRDAVEAAFKRKFGKGGPFHPETPGPFRDTRGVRSAAQVHSEEFRECAALQAQYVLDTFGRFPAQVPGVWCFQYLQAQHIDLEFYDTFFNPGAYLETHKNHWKNWHE